MSEQIPNAESGVSFTSFDNTRRVEDLLIALEQSEPYYIDNGTRYDELMHILDDCDGLNPLQINALVDSIEYELINHSDNIPIEIDLAYSLLYQLSSRDMYVCLAGITPNQTPPVDLSLYQHLLKMKEMYRQHLLEKAR